MKDHLSKMKNLSEVLVERVQQSGWENWLTLYSKDRIVGRMSYADLLGSARHWAAYLIGQGIQPQDRVLLVLPTEQAYYGAFWGILEAGAVPVPVYPPTRVGQIDNYLRRLQGIAVNCGASALITNSLIAPLLRPLTHEAGRQIRILTAKQLTTHAWDPAIEHQATDLAMLQYTSGSTGQQKGVMLTHANLLANLRAIGKGLGLLPEDVAVSWLPLYHDMGLIGLMMGSIYLGVPLISMSPIDFLHKPLRWIRLMSEHRATFTAAPNFAFNLVARKAKDAELDGIDLSAWRIALCGAEPIHPLTIENFNRRFGPHGFRPEAFFPAYGLAENTLAVSFSELSTLPTVEMFDQRILETEGRAVRQPAKDNTQTMVSTGRPLDGVEVAVLDMSGKPLAEGLQGEIALRGLSVMAGYYDNPQATAAVYTGGWLRTGDIGFMLDGQLYISGRLKDMIIKAGRNYFAEDLEASVASLPGVRPGGVCVFALSDPERGTDRVILLVESAAPTDKEELAAGLRKTMTESAGCRPDEIVVLSPRTLPKTSSGKLQRFKARQMYLDGTLQNHARGGKIRDLWIYTRALVREMLSSSAITRRTENRLGSNRCEGR